MGFRVVGSSGGGRGSGRSAWMLYHDVGISSGSSVTKPSFLFLCAILLSPMYILVLVSPLDYTYSHEYIYTLFRRNVHGSTSNCGATSSSTWKDTQSGSK